MKELRIEPRWPVALAVLALLFLLAATPGRVRAFPVWAPFVLGIVQIVPMAGVALTGAETRWRRAERVITMLLFVACGIGTLANLTHLIAAIAGRSGEIGGNRLLISSIAVWVSNVLAFSLLYWQLDRGGPETRANFHSPRPDWLFPQEGAPQDVLPDWQPTFVDYLFLGYSTATAFSTTDVMPLTSRAKMLMMLESAISLVTIVVVVSRAINILGN
jgi:uncharacterized membrane protein